MHDDVENKLLSILGLQLTATKRVCHNLYFNSLFGGMLFLCTKGISLPNLAMPANKVLQIE